MTKYKNELFIIIIFLNLYNKEYFKRFYNLIIKTNLYIGFYFIYYNIICYLNYLNLEEIDKIIN